MPDFRELRAGEIRDEMEAKAWEDLDSLMESQIESGVSLPVIMSHLDVMKAHLLSVLSDDFIESGD